MLRGLVFYKNIQYCIVLCQPITLHAVRRTDTFNLLDYQSLFGFSESVSPTIPFD